MINRKLVQVIYMFLLSSMLFGSSMYEDEMYRDEMLKNGEKIYQKTCISCHGKFGESNTKMKLVVKPRKLNKTILTPEQSFKIIKEGGHYWGASSDIMPTFKYVFSDDSIRDVTFYISETFNASRDKKIAKLLKESRVLSKEDEKKMLKIGKNIFTKECSLCHGINGIGESDYKRASKRENKSIYPYNLTKTLLNDKQIFLFAKYGAYYWGADKKDMHSWGERYNDIELKSVAKYVSEKIKKKQE